MTTPRLSATSFHGDYVTVPNLQADQVEALQPVFSTAQPYRGLGAYASQATPGSLVPFSAKASAWSAAASSARVALATPGGTGNGLAVLGVYPLSATQLLLLYVTSVGGANTLNALGLAVSAAGVVSQNTAAQAILPAPVQTFSMLFGAATSATSARFLVNVQGVSVAAAVLDVSLTGATWTGQVSPYSQAAGAFVYPSDTVNSGVTARSANTLGTLCGTGSLGGYLAGVYSGTYPLYSSTATAYNVGQAVAIGPGGSPDVVGEANARNAVHAYASSASTGYYMFQDHDFLGAYGAAGDQLMVTIGQGRLVGGSLSPVLTLWAIGDAGPRVLDRQAVADTFLATSAYASPVVAAIGPLTFFESHAFSGTSRRGSVWTVATSPVRGPYLRQVVAPSSTYVCGATGPLLPYSATLVYGVNPGGGSLTTQSYNLSSATYSASGGTLTSGSLAAFAHGQTLDASYTLAGVLRLGPDAFLMFGATGQSSATTSNTILAESFSLS